MKKSMLYASPFLPQKSGISDYSENLITGLAEYFDITLLVSGDYELANSDITGKFKVISYSRGADYSAFDCILYNFGNNPYFHSYIYDCFLSNPGYVILHDYVLFYLAAGYYGEQGRLYEAIYAMEGAAGVHIYADVRKRNSLPAVQQNQVASRLPMNAQVIGGAKGILVHSEFTRRRIMEEHGHANVGRINMVYMQGGQVERNALRDKYGIAEDAFVLASFGYIADTKQNRLVCEAVKAINRQGAEKIYYVMAGEGGCADDLLDDYIIKTGFVDRSEYDGIMHRADLVANLRYPSMGETSISVIHAMGMGKPCLVTDYAWFTELPDDAVIKTPYDITAGQLAEVITSSRGEAGRAVGEAARRLVEGEYMAASVAKGINNFIYAKNI